MAGIQPIQASNPFISSIDVNSARGVRNVGITATREHLKESGLFATLETMGTGELSPATDANFNRYA